MRKGGGQDDKENKKRIFHKIMLDDDDGVCLSLWVEPIVEMGDTATKRASWSRGCHMGVTEHVSTDNYAQMRVVLLRTTCVSRTRYDTYQQFPILAYCRSKKVVV